MQLLIYWIWDLKFEASVNFGFFVESVDFLTELIFVEGFNDYFI